MFFFFSRRYIWAKLRGIMLKITSDAAAKSKAEAAELQAKLREEMSAGRSVSEKIVAQQSELDDLRAQNERMSMELAMASIDLDAARAKIRKGDAIAKAIDERGLATQDVRMLKDQLDELLRRGGGIEVGSMEMKAAVDLCILSSTLDALS